MLMLCLSLFLTVTFILYGLYLIPHERKLKMRMRIARLTPSEQEKGGVGTNPAVAATEETLQRGLAHRLMAGAFGRIRRKLRRRMDEAKQAKLELLLHQAGRPMQMTPFDFRLMQTVLWLVFPVLAMMYGVFLLRSGPGLTVLLTMGAAVAAWRLPYLYLGTKAKARARQALRELPDVLDLLTVSLEAGLGFDSALGKLVSKRNGVLADELFRCLEEIRLGRTRREALIGVRDRIQLDEMRTLIGSILQAEKLGIGMVHVLRVQSVEMRDRRKQRAEEAAMKAPIKMLFPLVLFVFPCLFIVLLGPVLIQFMDTFGGSGGMP